MWREIYKTSEEITSFICTVALLKQSSGTDEECTTHGCFLCFPARRRSSAGCLRARRRPVQRCPAAWWRRAADLRSTAPSTPSAPAAAAGYSPSPPSPAPKTELLTYIPTQVSAVLQTHWHFWQMHRDAKIYAYACLANETQWQEKMWTFITMKPRTKHCHNMTNCSKHTQWSSKYFFP